MDLKSRLKTFFKGEMTDDQTHLDLYSSDASIFKIKPRIIVLPKDVEDIKNLVKFVKNYPKEKLSLTPRLAGTDMSGGAINDSIIVDLIGHFYHIKEIRESSVVVEPGVFYRDFEKETLKHNLILPCYTASREINTVGGMVANNSAGEKTLIFGQTQSYVKELKVVLSDGNEYSFKPLNRAELNSKMAQKGFEGNIYRRVYNLVDDNFDLIKSAKPKVTKNAAGLLLWEVWDKQVFNLAKLFVGSQGTLGIITEANLKLIKPTPHSKLLVIFLYDLNNLARIVSEVLTFKPESFESYDDQTLKVALKFLPELLKSTQAGSLLSLFWQFVPEIWMSFTGGMPKLILLAEFTGESVEEVDYKCMEARDALKEFNLKLRITQTEKEAKKYWTLRRESFNLLRHHSTHMRTAPFIDDIVVSTQKLPEFLPRLKAILDLYKDHLIYTIAGHIGNGNLHIIPLMDFTKYETKQIIPELSNKVYDLVKEFGGSISGEHNDGLMRGPYLEQMYGEQVYQLFKEVKEIFDPMNIFNPHKKVDASFEYSFSHLAEK